MWQDLENDGKCESIESEDTNEIENECPQNQNQNRITIHNRQNDDNNKTCLHRSPSLDVPAKERVRKVFHDWGSRSFEGHISNCSRAKSERENECKRVKIDIGCQTEQVQNGSVDLGVGGKRSIRRIYGRQAVLDLLAKFVRERKSEVDKLLENRFVSNFAHRHRIQALLKGRFLRNQRFVENEKRSSVAASELGLLRRTHAVSDIRKGFLSRLNNHNHASDIQQSDSDNENIEQAEEIIHHEIPEEFETCNSPVRETQDNIPQYEERDIPPPTIEFTETRIKCLQDDSKEETNQNTCHMELLPQEITSDTEHITHVPQVDEIVRLHSLQTSTDSLNWKEEWEESDTEEDDSEWDHLTPTESDEGINVNSPLRSESQESHEEWYDNVHAETPERWFGGNYSGRSNAFNWFDDDNDNDNNVELTELTNRRTVSNLLQSDFGPRLDRLLMQSYVNRQNEVFDSENEGGIETVADVDQTQGDIIDGLRNDMDKLHERMDEMQRMLEACMDMQLELQKSVHQEVYSALNQPSCYLCCDDGFESLPNRSGSHMYICSQCGDKLNWSKLKESVK